MFLERLPFGSGCSDPKVEVLVELIKQVKNNLVLQSDFILISFWPVDCFKPFIIADAMIHAH